ncbi:hypothetical protein [Marmoricola sp. RAF53]|uniref:hypothetical protein n=1 Tax=Marmoricola sp. RAF53 TaxID=3233059 RepID=UPI003F956269
MSDFNPYAGPHPVAPDETSAPATVQISRRWALFWAWTGLLAGVVVTFVGTFAASALVYFGQSAGCDEVANEATIEVGMRSLLGVLGVAAVPWALAGFFSRHKVVVGIAAVIALTPALYALAHGLTPGAWDDGWCF